MEISNRTSSEFKELQTQIDEILKLSNKSVRDCEDFRPKVSSFEENLNAAMEEVRSIKLNITDLDTRKLERENLEEYKFTNEKRIKLVQGKNEEINSVLETLCNFIEKYMPMMTERQISSALNYMSTHKIKHKLEGYFKLRYKHLFQTILDDKGVHDLQSKIKKMQELIAQSDSLGAAIRAMETEKEPFSGHSKSNLQLIPTDSSPGLTAKDSHPQFSDEEGGNPNKENMKEKLKLNRVEDKSMEPSINSDSYPESKKAEGATISQEEPSLMKDINEDTGLLDDRKAFDKKEFDDEFNHLMQKIDYKFSCMQGDLQSQFKG